MELENPWRQFHKNIVLLIINDKFSDYSGSGTGTIVQEGIIITCSHNFIGRDQQTNLKSRATQVQIYYRQKQNDKLRQITAKKWYVIFDYFKNKQNDFAILTYQHTEDIRFETLHLNWFYSYWSLIRQFQQKDLSIYLYGYRVKDNIHIKQNVLYNCAENQKQKFMVLRDNLKGLRYQSQTYYGISGSPIILVNKYRGREYYYMIGIHTRGHNDNHLNYGVELNVNLQDRCRFWLQIQDHDQVQDQLDQKFDRQLSALNLEEQDLDYQLLKLLSNFSQRNQVQLTNLKYLNLRKNNLPYDQLSLFSKLKFDKLQSLILSQNNVAYGIGHLKDLKQLKLLHISNIQMTSLDKFFDISQSLIKIRDLDLSENRIGHIFDKGDSKFPKLVQLRYLSLANTGFTNFSSLDQLNLKQLRSLDLRSQSIEDILINQIQKYLKNGNKTLSKLEEICYNKKSTQEDIISLNCNQYIYYSLIRQSTLVSYSEQKVQKILLNRTNIYDNIIGYIPKYKLIQNSNMINNNLQLSSQFNLVKQSTQIPFFCVGLINKVLRQFDSIKNKRFQFSVGTMVSDNLMLTSSISFRYQDHFFPGMSETKRRKGFIKMKIKQTILDQINYCLVNVNTEQNIAIPYLNIYNPNDNLYQYKEVIQVCYKIKDRNYGQQFIKDQFIRVLSLTYNKKKKEFKQKDCSLDFKQLKKKLYIIQGSPLLFKQNNQYKLLGITTVQKNGLPRYIHCSEFFDAVDPYTNSICHPSNLNLWHKKIPKQDLKYFIQRMSFKKLIRLDLGWNYLNDQSAKTLFMCEDKFINLQQLNLNTNLIKHGIKKFRSQNLPSLIQLSIANNFIQNKGFQSLYNKLKDSRIRILDIRNNSLTDQIIGTFLGQILNKNKKRLKQDSKIQQIKQFKRLSMIILENSFFKNNQNSKLLTQIQSYRGISQKQSRKYIYINSSQQFLQIPPNNK